MTTWFLLVGLLVLACTEKAPPPAELRIGVVLQLGNVEGPAAVKALQLQAEQINAAGGVPYGEERARVELIIRTDHQKPDEAVAAARELIYQQGAHAIVGPFLSRDAIPVGEAAESAQVPMVSPGSSHPKTTEGRDWVFRVTFLDDFQGLAMARYAREGLEVEEAALLYNVAEPYSSHLSDVFRETFESVGGRITAVETYTFGETDFSQNIARIREAGASAVFMPSPNRELLPQIREARRQNLDVAYLGCDSWSISGLVAEPGMANAFAVQHWHPDMAKTLPEAEHFLTSYRNRFGEEPGDVTALAWDALGLIFEAARSGISSEAIRDGLANIRNYNGATGEITFTGYGGNPPKAGVIVGIEDGRLILQQRITP